MLKAVAAAAPGSASGGAAGPTPATSTDNAVVRWDGTSGRLIQNSVAATIDDSGNAAFNSVAAKALLTVDVDGRTIDIAETGSVYTNGGAVARADFTLPAAAAGLVFSFVCADTDGIRVIAGSGDDITLGTSSTALAGRIDATALYSSVTLVAIDATHWVALGGSSGTWVVT